jgi:hypothetical protein
MSALPNAQRASCDCGPRRPETFRHLKGLYVYDVDRANALVADGRTAVEIAVESVRQCVDEAVLNEAHLAHVDPSVPGIVAILNCATEDGVLRTHVMIDGHHRAARCLQLGTAFRAYLLSEQESEQVLLHKPVGILRRNDIDAIVETSTRSPLPPGEG